MVCPKFRKLCYKNSGMLVLLKVEFSFYGILKLQLLVMYAYM